MLRSSQKMLFLLTIGGSLFFLYILFVGSSGFGFIISKLGAIGQATFAFSLGILIVLSTLNLIPKNSSQKIRLLWKVFAAVNLSLIVGLGVWWISLALKLLPPLA